VLGIAAAAAVAAVALVVVRWPRNHDQRTLAVPVDTTVASRIGPHTAASIVGPARIDILGSSGDATAVRLHSGTLLAEFTSGPGRSLRIDAPGAVVEVVGTLFAVEARGGATCASVAHGRVRVTTAAGVVHVEGGQRYCTGDAIRPIADDMRDALARHDATLLARGTPPAGAPEAARAADKPAAEDSPPALAVVPASASPPSVGAPHVTDASRSAAVPPANATSTSPSSIATGQGSRSMGAPPSGTGRSRPSGTPPSATAPSRSAVALPADATSQRRSPVTPPSAASPSQPAIAPPPDATNPSPTARIPSQGTTSTAGLPAVSARPVAPEPAPPRQLTPDELYRAAEAALAARDLAAADRALGALVTEHPGSQLLDQALYERARIAYQQRAWSAARSHLARLAALPGTLLAEPGHYLRCRVAVESRDPSAATCLAGYRAAFPRSPHDLDALALLAQLAHDRGGCAGAAALIDELAQSYPRTTLAAAWRARCPETR
jgi:TolA-binding protein